jgi:hypothetical protein
MVVSADAILQADATLVVGVVFLATLREALKLPFTASFFRSIYLATFLFMISALGILNEGATIIGGHDLWHLIGRNSLPLGLLLVSYALYRLMVDLRTKEASPSQQERDQNR